jgi:acyl carrier protein
MEEQKIFDEFINIIRVYAKDTELVEKATKETHILNDLKVNSARLVDIIIKCEDVFGIEIDDDDADKIRTVGDAIEVVKSKVA